MDAENRNRYGNRQLKVVACSRKRDRSVTVIGNPHRLVDKEADKEHQHKINHQRDRHFDDIHWKFEDLIALEAKHQDYGEEQGIKRDRRNGGNKPAVVPFFSFGFRKEIAAQETCKKRNTEINQYTFRHIAHRDTHIKVPQTQFLWQYIDEEPHKKAIRKNLEDAVESDQKSGIFTVAFGQIVPNNYHRDASC